MTLADAPRIYSGLGYNPLPSATCGRKRLLASFARLGCGWAVPVAPVVLDRWPVRWPGANVQLMCGAAWRLCVIDLDGSAAAAWDALTLYRPVPRTWTVRTGGGGWHLWFRTPAGLETLPTRLVWDGGGRHDRIELLGDRSLVVAPPSVHVETRRPYTFAVGPRDMPAPAELPGWAIDLPDVRRKPVPAYVPPVARPMPPGRWHYDRKAVLAAIPPGERVSLARSWGLRIVGDEPNGSGWLPCKAVGREDYHPSAGFNVNSACYCEPPGLRMSLFELGAVLGVAPTWIGVVDALGMRYGVAA